ncbi:DUF418 domain-containing protein [Bacillus sp. REN10]|uniref:DUF418 domain-containing protein n=1 Tax=Bacillus sp. REN10 TaxID=2782541 RepID=UPI00193B63AB|nr:DUF418 domain-containing protein [Bacillus sp. REN10]
MDKYRVSAIDGMRGFSLLGILLANMLIFQYGIWGKDEIVFYSLSATDTAAYKLVKVLVEGSFMPIFTFLFGYSMIKMKESLERKGVPVKRYFMRRFFFLIGAGLLHSTFLWEGDILFFYGLMGFFLLLFMNRSKKTLLIWGTALLIIMSFLGYGNMEESAQDKKIMAEYIEKTKIVYSSGSYVDIMNHRNNEDPLNLPDAFYVVLLIFAPLLTAPLFLFGMFAAKVNAFVYLQKERLLYVKGAILFLPIGIILKIIPHVTESSWSGVAEMLGASLLALGYIFLFALLYTRKTNKRFSAAFENIGKLSLTNYLMQTVICTTIFYGYGFGLFGKLGMIWGILLAVVIYALQAICSHYYLKLFNRGPVEQLLRMWTNFSWNGYVKGRRASIEEKLKKAEGMESA